MFWTTKEIDRILLVEDDDDVIWAVNALLTMKGHEVDIVKTGIEAIKKLKRQKYNLAIIDINLPDITGLDLLEKMKEINPRMRKIIMTGYATADNAINALNFGADFFLKKPVDLQEFTTVIEAQLEKQREESKNIALKKELPRNN